MATYDELMVYKHAYDLTVELMTLTKKMDKAYKFTLGELFVAFRCSTNMSRASRNR